MTCKENNPLCLSPGEVVTMDTVGGTFSATTDEDGLYKFVVFFFDNRTYTFRVWYDAATYEDAEENKKDEIDINVSKLKVVIRVSDNAVAEIGEEVEIRGISNIGESVDIVINDILEFDNVTGDGMDGLYVSIMDPTFVTSDAFSYGEIGIRTKGDGVEINAPEGKIVFDMPSTCIIGENVVVNGWASEGNSVDIAMDDIVKAVDIPIENGTFCTVISSAGYSPGAYKIEGFIDGNYSVGEDVSGEESDGSTTIRLIVPGLTVNISTNETVRGGSFMINGTATGTDYVDIITISPKGGAGAGLYEKSYPCVPGITNESIPVENNSFSKTINVSVHADIGKYVIWVSIPGRDGYYGNWSGVNASDIIMYIIDCYCGGDPSELRSKTQDQILDMLQDATYEATGSDDLIWTGKNIVVTQFDAFDTGESENPYPSIYGTHNGIIIPSHDINVSMIYTYPCIGTGGHTEYIRIWNNSNCWNVTANWHGYAGDWHNLSFNEPFTLEAGKRYNYTIRTGSYPQIIHNHTHTTLDGSFINCTEFTDVNGKRYNNWIPAIKLFRQ